MPDARSDLPSGTVTFLFTDVEGSTKLLHELGAEAYAEALAEHRRVIREACAADGGVEVDTQGDAFFFAFPTAPGAVAAAEAMTEALAAGPIQVRIGLHTGTPLLDRGGLRRQTTSTSQRASPPPATAARCILSAATARARRARADRPRRAPAQGHLRAGADLPARRRLVPAAEDDLQHEPAAAGELVRRPRRRARGGARRASRTARASSR